MTEEITGFDMTDVHPGNFEGFVKARKRAITIDALKVNLPEGFIVRTLEGTMRGNPGDWLLIGVKGEKYPCAAEVFDASYDVVGQDDSRPHVSLLKRATGDRWLAVTSVRQWRDLSSDSQSYQMEINDAVGECGPQGWRSPVIRIGDPHDSKRLEHQSFCTGLLEAVASFGMNSVVWRARSQGWEVVASPRFGSRDDPLWEAPR